MLKNIISLLLICAVFALPDSIFGQSETLRNSSASSSNLRQIFVIKSDAIDFTKLDRQQMKSVSKSKWTNQQKTLLWFGIGAAIAATIILVVVSKKDNDSAENNCFATCTAVGCPPAPPCP